MADTKTSALTALTAPVRADAFPIYDDSAAELKKILHSKLCYSPAFTPVVSDASSGGNDSPTAATGASCSIIGNMMLIRFVFSDIDTTGMTAGNTLYITGLPETVVAGGQQVGSAYVSSTGLTHAPTLIFAVSSTYMYFTEFGSGNMKVSDLSSGVSDIFANAALFIS